MLHYQNAKEKALKQGKNLFLIPLSDAPWDPLFIVAVSEKAAKQQALKYKRTWQIYADICGIYQLFINEKDYTESELRGMCL